MRHQSDDRIDLPRLPKKSCVVRRCYALTDCGNSSEERRTSVRLQLVYGPPIDQWPVRYDPQRGHIEFIETSVAHCRGSLAIRLPQVKQCCSVERLKTHSEASWLVLLEHARRDGY